MKLAHAVHLLLVLLAAASWAYAYDEVRLNLAPDGSGVNGLGSFSNHPLSADGRFVVFDFAASGLLPDDLNGYSDVFLYDRETSLLSIVSRAADGSQGNGDSYGGVLSADARYVAFDSTASNLVAGDTNEVMDVFRRDLQTGEVIRISVASDGTQGDVGSFGPSISADGRYIAFGSDATTLIAGDANGLPDAFVHDCVTGQTLLVDVTSTGAPASTGVPEAVEISADGRYVLFYSGGPDLVPGDTSGWKEVFLRNLESGTTERVSIGPSGQPASANCYGPGGVSADGRFVTFGTYDASFAEGVSGAGSVFVRDRVAGATTLASIGTAGEVLLGYQTPGGFSDEGRLISFGGSTGYLRDLAGGQTRAARSVPAPSASGNAYADIYRRTTGGTEVFTDLWVQDNDLYGFGATSGTVTGDSGPVAGAEVWIDGYLWTRTGADGTYRFPAVAEGSDYTMTVRAGDVAAEAQHVAVVAGQTATVDFMLTQAGAIHGTITNADTGAPVAGATVVCGAQRAATAGDGTYLLAFIPAGSGLSVTASAPGYDPQQAVGITVVAGQTMTLDFTMHVARGAIGGVVRNAMTQAPISGATVQCETVTTTSASDGSYLLAAVPAGAAHAVVATAVGYRQGLVTGVMVASPQTTTLDFALQPLIPELSGRVIDSVTGLPLAGATITAGALSKTADAWGRYRFYNLAPGTYDVTATASGYVAASVPGVTVAPYERRVLDLALTAASSGTISGVVSDASSAAPLANALVTCGSARTTTGVDGSYSLAGIAARGSYQVGAALGGYRWALQSGVTVTAGQTTEVNLALTPIGGGEAFEDYGAALGLPASDGGAWGDYDGDGWPDLYLPGAGHAPVLLHNDGGFAFTDVTAALGLPTTATAERGAAWADYDGDGALDLVVTGAAAPGNRRIFLRHNDGGTFREVAGLAGLALGLGEGASAAWGDYDGDGWLDLFVGAVAGGQSRLFHSNRDGTFSDVTEAAGLADVGESAAGVWGDMDRDGRADLVVGQGTVGRVRVFHNAGDGEFVGGPVGDESMIYVPNGIALGDYDNDGWLDICTTVGSWGEEVLLHNEHDGSFTRRSGETGLSIGFSRLDGGLAWGDYNSDGALDLYAAEIDGGLMLFRSNGNSTFAWVRDTAGLVAQLSVAACWADGDVDGHLDLVSTGGQGEPTRLYRNLSGGGNWLRVRALTSGAGDATGAEAPTRDALGAMVEVNVDNDSGFPSGRTLTRLVDGGSGLHSQNEPIAQFGVPTDGPVAMRVTFPDGSVVIQRDLALNRTVVVKDVAGATRIDLFPDVPLDYWAGGQIEACVEAGIVQGYGNGTYVPLGPVDRAGMAVFISRALAGGDGSVPEHTGADSFTDVPADHWAYKYIEYAQSHGVVQGYAGGAYSPDAPVDRGQMAVFIARAIAGGDGSVPSPTGGIQSFGDVAPDYWAYRYIEYCQGRGVVRGYPDGSYRPTQGVARDQMAVYIQRAFWLPM